MVEVRGCCSVRNMQSGYAADDGAQMVVSNSSSDGDVEKGCDGRWAGDHG